MELLETISKMVDFNSNPLLMTLKANGLNTPFKKQRFSYCFLQGSPFKYKNTE